MNEPHPITPPELKIEWNEQQPISAPPELVRQWCDRDNERESYGGRIGSHPLTPAWEAHRRPKPPSLKQQAQRILVENGTTIDGRMELEPEDIEILSAALELLPDEEV